MKVLFYLAAHFNSDLIGPQLEKIQDHLNNNDEVTIFYCNKELTSCHINPHHSTFVCLNCKSFLKNGLSKLIGNYTLKTLNDILPFSESNSRFELIDKSSIENFKSIKYHNFDIGSAVLSTIVSEFRDPEPDLIKNEAFIKKQWESAIWVYHLFNKELQENIYDRVYVFNGRVATLRACFRSCLLQKVDCYILEAGRTLDFYNIYINELPHSITYNEKLINEIWENAPEDKMKIAEHYFEKRSKGKDSIVGHFTSSQTLEKLPPNWNSKIENIGIFISSEDEFVSIGDEWNNPIYSSQLNGIKDILDYFSNDTNIHFYVRIHPNLIGVLNVSTINLHQLNNHNLTVIPGESDISTYALLLSCDKVISFGSSVGIEAAAFNKPSILIGKSFYHNLGSTYNPSNKQELFDLIRTKNLDPKSHIGAYKYGYYLDNCGFRFKHFQTLTKFESLMNGQKFGPNMLLLSIRKIGRALNLKKSQKRKIKNSAILLKMLDEHR